MRTRTRVLQRRCRHCRRRNDVQRAVGGGAASPLLHSAAVDGPTKTSDHGCRRCRCNNDTTKTMPWGGDDNHEARIRHRRRRVMRAILCHPFRGCAPRQSSASSSFASSSSYSSWWCCCWCWTSSSWWSRSRRTPHRCEHPIGIPRPLGLTALLPGRPRRCAWQSAKSGCWHGCGADGTRRGREGVSLGSSPIQGTPGGCSRSMP